VRLVALVALVACKSSSTPHVESHAIDPGASLEIVSEEVSFAAGAEQVPGTLVHPKQTGRWPGVVLIAGSGPTDRDWNNPLLVGKNGSGKLLAEAIARRGAVVVRYDKASIGANKTTPSDVTIDTYVGEGRAALALLRARSDVAATKLYVAGHSEGGLHAIRVALAEGDHIAGLVLLSAAGRSLEDLLLVQLGAQLRAAMPAQADAELQSLKKALDEFAAGKEVDPKQVSAIPGIQNLVAALVAPMNAKVARGLIAFDPLPAVAQIAVPVFIYNGKHDLQVDADVDAKNLIAARKGKPTEVFLAPEADHVLKHEPKAIPELRANPAATQNGYNDPARALDDATVSAIVTWLAKH